MLACTRVSFSFHDTTSSQLFPADTLIELLLRNPQQDDCTTILATWGATHHISSMKLLAVSAAFNLTVSNQLTSA